MEREIRLEFNCNSVVIQWERKRMAVREFDGDLERVCEWREGFVI